MGLNTYKWRVDSILNNVVEVASYSFGGQGGALRSLDTLGVLWDGVNRAQKEEESPLRMKFCLQSRHEHCNLSTAELTGLLQG